MITVVALCALGATLTGQGITLELPDDTAAYGSDYGPRLLARLERARALVADQLPRWHRAPPVQVIVQPDVATFTRRCGRPWFSAGAWLPPPRVLEKRDRLDEELAHELAHAMLHRALRGCPRWYVEGLMLLLAGQQGAATGAAVEDLDAALRSPASRSQASQAYHLARERVARLTEARSAAALIGASPTLCSHLRLRFAPGD